MAHVPNHLFEPVSIPWMGNPAIKRTPDDIIRGLKYANPAEETIWHEALQIMELMAARIADLQEAVRAEAEQHATTSATLRWQRDETERVRKSCNEAHRRGRAEALQAARITPQIVAGLAKVRTARIKGRKTFHIDDLLGANPIDDILGRSEP